MKDSPNHMHIFMITGLKYNPNKSKPEAADSITIHCWMTTKDRRKAFFVTHPMTEIFLASCYFFSFLDCRSLMHRKHDICFLFSSMILFLQIGSFRLSLWIQILLSSLKRTRMVGYAMNNECQMFPVAKIILGSSAV